MYANADKSPVKVDADTLLNISTGVKETPFTSITLSPNPTADGKIQINGLGYRSFQLEVFDQNGKKMIFSTERKNNTLELHLPQPRGIYFVRININGKIMSYKILKI